MSSVAAQPPVLNHLSNDIRLPLSEVLGTLAHELRQPLSNIEAIAYYLRMILPPGEVKILAQIARIRELVEQSNWILSSALSLASSASVAPQFVALEELITEAVFSSSGQADVRLALSGDLPPVHLDPREGRELIESLLMLFLTMRDRATDGTGFVTLTTSARLEGGVLLEIQATGKSSMGGAGSELALENARRIAVSHGGTFEVDAGEPAGGIRGRLMLP